MSLILPYYESGRSYDARCNSEFQAKYIDQWPKSLRPANPPTLRKNYFCSPCVQPTPQGQCCCTCWQMAWDGIDYDHVNPFLFDPRPKTLYIQYSQQPCVVDGGYVIDCVYPSVFNYVQFFIIYNGLVAADNIQRISGFFLTGFITCEMTLIKTQPTRDYVESVYGVTLGPNPALLALHLGYGPVSISGGYSLDWSGWLGFLCQDFKCFGDNTFDFLFDNVNAPGRPVWTMQNSITLQPAGAFSRDGLDCGITPRYPPRGDVTDRPCSVDWTGYDAGDPPNVAGDPSYGNNVSRYSWIAEFYDPNPWSIYSGGPGPCVNGQDINSKLLFPDATSAGDSRTWVTNCPEC